MTSPDDYHYKRVNGVCMVGTLIALIVIFMSILGVMIGLDHYIYFGVGGVILLIISQSVKNRAHNDRAHGLPPKLPWE